jgi:hypothetical protein
MGLGSRLTLRLDRRPGTDAREPELRPQLPHKAVRGNSLRMAPEKAEGQSHLPAQRKASDRTERPARDWRPKNPAAGLTPIDRVGEVDEGHQTLTGKPLRIGRCAEGRTMVARHNNSTRRTIFFRLCRPAGRHRRGAGRRCRGPASVTALSGRREVPCQEHPGRPSPSRS